MGGNPPVDESYIAKSVGRGQSGELEPFLQSVNHRGCAGNYLNTKKKVYERARCPRDGQW